MIVNRRIILIFIELAHHRYRVWTYLSQLLHFACLVSYSLRGPSDTGRTQRQPGIRFLTGVRLLVRA